MFQITFHYFKSLYYLLKQLAFHELYMQSHREDLAKCQYYDPLTAFKSMDCFRHNNVSPYELQGFLDKNGISGSYRQCENIIRSVNKSNEYLDYQKELTFPKNVNLVNQSTSKFDNLNVQIGTYTLVDSVKRITQNQIALFLQRELNFNRKFQNMQFQHLKEYGNDIYTFEQAIFKGKYEQINAKEIMQHARSFGLIFNNDQIMAIYNRTKNQSGTKFQDKECIKLTRQQLRSVLLVTDFNQKEKYFREQGVPFTQLYTTTPVSYVPQKWQKQLYYNEQHQNSMKQAQKGNGSKLGNEVFCRLRNQREKGICKFREKQSTFGLKYKYQEPEGMRFINGKHWDLRKKAVDWEREMENMTEKEIALRYYSRTPNTNIHYF